MCIAIMASDGTPSSCSYSAIDRRFSVPTISAENGGNEDRLSAPGLAAVLDIEKHRDEDDELHQVLQLY
jgi:hypothetical protein